MPGLSYKSRSAQPPRRSPGSPAPATSLAPREAQARRSPARARTPLRPDASASADDPATAVSIRPSWQTAPECSHVSRNGPSARQTRDGSCPTRRRRLARLTINTSGRYGRGLHSMGNLLARRSRELCRQPRVTGRWRRRIHGRARRGRPRIDRREHRRTGHRHRRIGPRRHPAPPGHHAAAASGMRDRLRGPRPGHGGAQRARARRRARLRVPAHERTGVVRAPVARGWAARGAALRGGAPGVRQRDPGLRPRERGLCPGRGAVACDGALPGQRAHLRRDRHRQGGLRAGGALSVVARGAAVGRRQLRGDPRRPGRERVVRPRQGCVHRRARGACRNRSRGRGRHAVPR